MTHSPLKSTPPTKAVDLSEDEFNDVYDLLKMCLAAEMGIDDKAVPDGEEFANSCQRIVNAGATPGDNKVYDMSHGFIPLYQRLYNAKDAPLKQEGGTVYRVEF
jgi:hypothetical protein